MIKNMIVVLMVACVCAFFLALGIWVFGNAFNDTGSKQWQDVLNRAVLWTFVIAALTIVLVLWEPGFLHKDGVRLIVALIGAVACLVIASSPFTITLPKWDKQAKDAEFQEAQQTGVQLLATVQSYIQSKHALSSKEIQDFLSDANNILYYQKIESGLEGWGQLLKAKLVGPNISVEKKNYDKKNTVSNEPLLSYTMRLYDSRFAEELLSFGADPNKSDDASGDTPLIQTAKSIVPGPDKLNLLLSCGADVFIKNKQGKTVLDILQENRVRIEQDTRDSVPHLADVAKKQLQDIDEEIAAVKIVQSQPVKSGACVKKE